jgi:hypothetical protein
MSNNINRHLSVDLWLRAKQIILITSLLILSACGGGGTTGSATPHLFDSFGRDVFGSRGFGRGSSGADGSAGDGAPIANAPVVITGLTGSPVTTTTDAQGYYQADVTGLTAPLSVTVTKPDGTGLRYSFSIAALQPDKFVTINITGLTTQIVSDVASALGLTAGPSVVTPALLNSQPALVGATVATSIDAQKTQLATLMGAAGVSTSTYNPISTPFVTDHTGYDYLLDQTVVTVPPTGATTTAPLPTFNPIIGAWSLASSSLAVTFTFSEDGHYNMAQAQVGANAVALQVWPGLEYGTYAYNISTGDLSFACPSVDTNGTAGTSGGYTGGFNDSGVPIGTCNAILLSTTVVNGNTITLTNASNGQVNTFNRIADSTKPLVGSWVMANATPPRSVVFTFTSDGYYTMSQVAVTAGFVTTNQAWPGIEYGTYTWNVTSGAMSLGCALVDTNGTTGFSSVGNTNPNTTYTDGLISSGNTPVGTVGGGQPIGPCQTATHDVSVTTAGNVMTLVGPFGTRTLNRVVYGGGI